MNKLLLVLTLLALNSSLQAVPISYSISGEVLDGTTGLGLGALRVEAWDRDLKSGDLLDKDFSFDDLVDVATTDSIGRFAMSFDSTSFAEDVSENGPDLYFKIFQSTGLLLYRSSVMQDAGQNIRVTLVIPSETGSPVPLPSTLLLFAAGFIGLAFARPGKRFKS